jgi:hypothetical protein
MKKSFYCLWIVLIIIQEFLQYGQTQFIGDDPLGPLDIDQAYLNITNKNYPNLITVKHNLVVCEKCDFESLADSIGESSSHNVKVNTKYTHDFEIFIEPSNTTLSCEVKSYKFSEGGSYLFEIIKTQNNQSSCSINPINEPSSFHYWLPLLIALVIILLFIIFTQVWHCIFARFTRLLPNAVQQGFALDDFTISLPRGPTLIANDANDPNDDIINALATPSDLISIGSTRNNPFQIKKVVPKRLRSLDTFRGFSLMVMIFVNYGGKIFLIFSCLLKFLVY